MKRFTLDHEFEVPSNMTFIERFGMYGIGFKLVREFGIFNTRTNPKGVVRDHLLSRRFGYENHIPPSILSHPANCEIIQHGENVSRAQRGSGDNQITLEELKERIENYDKKYSK